MRRPGLREPCPARRRQLGIQAPAIGLAARPLDRAREHEAIDEPRQPALAEDDGGGEIRHPQPLLGSAVEDEEHLVLVQRELVGRPQLGIEAADEIRVRPQHAPPGRELDGGEATGVDSRDVCICNYTT